MDQIVDQPPAAQTSPIAGFWRRAVALWLDGLVLGVPALALGLALFRWASSLGQGGRLIGFVAALLYFGLLDSRAGGGQTVGKRLLGIRVTGGEGNLLSPARAAARFLVIGIPWFLNGLYFGAGAAGWLTYLEGLLLSFVVFGGLGGAAYLMVFNRRTRQCLNDLAVGSFVVRAPATRVPAGLVTPRLHLIVLGCWLALTLLLPAAGVWTLSQSSIGAAFRPLTALQAALGEQAGLSQVKVTMGSTGFASTNAGMSITSFLRVEAQTDAWYDDLGALGLSIAGRVLELQPDLLGRQVLIVEVRRGFDFGIARWSNTEQEAHDAAAWRHRLARDPAAADKI